MLSTFDVAYYRYNIFTVSLYHNIDRLVVLFIESHYKLLKIAEKFVI